MREPQVCSCSTAAARKVSAAPKVIFFPSRRSVEASLAQEVVLPVPFTPTINMADGVCEDRVRSFCERCPLRISLRERSASLPFIFFASSRREALRLGPKSAPINYRSNSCQSSGSAVELPLTFARNLLKIPILIKQFQIHADVEKSLQ